MWISIGERTPELFGKNLKVSEYVLVTNGYIVSTAYRYEDNGDEFWIIGEFSDRRISGIEITHWMPLPELPKEAE